jgi:hypothetical protein
MECTQMLACTQALDNSLEQEDEEALINKPLVSLSSNTVLLELLDIRIHPMKGKLLIKFFRRK